MVDKETPFRLGSLLTVSHRVGFHRPSSFCRRKGCLPIEASGRWEPALQNFSNFFFRESSVKATTSTVSLGNGEINTVLITSMGAPFVKTWLEEIYRDHRESLFHLAWLILRDRSLAEDAVHSGFVKLASIDSLPQHPLNYARQAIRNSAIDLNRSRAVRATDELFEAQTFVADDSSELNLISNEMLRRLNDQQREVVECHLRLSMSFKEIAELLGEPLSTVSSRYQRALSFLRTTNEVHDE